MDGVKTVQPKYTNPDTQQLCWEEDIRIVDGHCHLASARYFPDALFEGLARNNADRLQAADRPVPLDRLTAFIKSQYNDDHADRLVAEMDEAGIEQTVLLLPDFTHDMPCPLPYDEMVAEHAQVKQRHAGRFFLFYGVDPRYGDEGIGRFKALVDRFGIDGVKLYPPCGYSPSDPALDPVYDMCGALGIPVLLHTGPTVPSLRFDFADPELIDRAAHAFPDVRFILAHGAVNHADKALYQAMFRPNVFLDASGFLGVPDSRLFAEQFQMLCSHQIAHKVIFGTDWPIFRGQGDLRSAVARFRADDGPLCGRAPDEIRRIMGGTIRSLIPAETVG